MIANDVHSRSNKYNLPEKLVMYKWNSNHLYFAQIASIFCPKTFIFWVEVNTPLPPPLIRASTSKSITISGHSMKFFEKQKASKKMLMTSLSAFNVNFEKISHIVLPLFLFTLPRILAALLTHFRIMLPS